MRPIAIALAALMPSMALAVGGGSATPPTPTETTTACADGTVWDDTAKACVAPKQSSLDDDALYRALRELAYAGRYDDALRTIAAMSEGDSDRVLTYRGFIARKTGSFADAVAYYDAALARNPDNLLARSYLGQGYAEEGRRDLARAQLSEIRARGGRGTWPELALRLAIETGRGYAY